MTNGIYRYRKLQLSCLNKREEKNEKLQTDLRFFLANVKIIKNIFRAWNVSRTVFKFYKKQA